METNAYAERFCGRSVSCLTANGVTFKDTLNGREWERGGKSRHCIEMKKKFDKVLIMGRFLLKLREARTKLLKRSTHSSWMNTVS